MQQLYPILRGALLLLALPLAAQAQTRGIGIGTSNPVGALQIEQAFTSANPALLLLRTTNGTATTGPAIDFQTYAPASATNSAARIQALDPGAYTADLAFSLRNPGAEANALVERLRIANTGNVGVGSNNPRALLHLERGTTGANPTLLLLRSTNGAGGGGAALDFQNYDTGNDGPGARLLVTDAVNYSSDVAFLTRIPGAGNNALAERLRILSDGKVNIGAGATPTATLDVNGSTRLRGLSTAGIVTTTANGTLSSATAASLDATTAGSGLTRAGTNITLGGTALSANTTIPTGGFSLSIEGTGNVAIGGSAAPTSTLQVNGSTAVAVGNGLVGNPTGTPLGNVGYAGLSPASGNDYYLLPDATTCTGRIYYIRNNSSSNIAYLGTAGGAIFEGSATNASSTPYFMQASGPTKTVTVISDGANWTLLKAQ
ncbi:hypothetical protein Q5H93_20260 [Hymenobacter sp. ASUV-10]|uniref:Uncharacterized protein n=1 Tax=Hymenobacter aranciens TaxID=3063996 RepID=A0ABT9BH23_9BACT|nr:hypothetical protein [Hymenobacter sp. ASUV-10]MDO7877090.1 hypothetical protein [Hymenobacter sp. ASUV-10]